MGTRFAIPKRTVSQDWLVLAGASKGGHCMERSTFLLLVISRSVLVGRATAASVALAGADANDTLALDHSGSDTHSVTTTASRPVRVVEADFEPKSVGNGPTTVTLVLRAPDGVTLATRRMTLDPGRAGDLEVSHAFPDARAPSVHAASLAVGAGAVRLTEGGVAINGEDDGEDDADGEDAGINDESSEATPNEAARGRALPSPMRKA